MTMASVGRTLEGAASPSAPLLASVDGLRRSRERLLGLARGFDDVIVCAMGCLGLERQLLLGSPWPRRVHASQRPWSQQLPHGPSAWRHRPWPSPRQPLHDALRFWRALAPWPRQPPRGPALLLARPAAALAVAASTLARSSSAARCFSACIVVFKMRSHRERLQRSVVVDTSTRFGWTAVWPQRCRSASPASMLAHLARPSSP